MHSSEATDIALLRQAIALAREHMQAGHGGPFGAVIAQNDQVVGRGWNQVTSSNDPTAHAEIVAIRSAARTLEKFHLSGCVLYTSCEPCPMCLAAAYWAKVDRIVYAATRADAAEIGFRDDNLYRELTLPIGERSLPMQQRLRAEARETFQAWTAKPDKVCY